MRHICQTDTITEDKIVTEVACRTASLATSEVSNEAPVSGANRYLQLEPEPSSSSSSVKEINFSDWESDDDDQMDAILDNSY